MKVADVSRWQNEIDWDKFHDEISAVVIKATGGDRGLYVDSEFIDNRDSARAKGVPMWFYHFAGLTNPIEEADHFVNSVGELQAGEGLVLDYEKEVQGVDSVQWCLQFVNRIKERVGFAPLFYTNEARVLQFDWQPLVDAGCGLWVAKYGDNDTIPEEHEKPQTGKWPFAAMWQYTSLATAEGITGNTVDMNEFYGDVEQFKKYGKPAGENPTPPAPPVAPTPPPAPEPAPTQDEYHVAVPRNTMSGIAKKYGLTLEQLIQLNPHKRANPNNVQIGERFLVKRGSGTPVGGDNKKYYIVQGGDTLTKISRMWSTPIDSLMAWNPFINDRNLIKSGWKIRVK